MEKARLSHAPLNLWMLHRVLFLSIPHLPRLLVAVERNGFILFGWKVYFEKSLHHAGVDQVAMHMYYAGHGWDISERAHVQDCAEIR